MIRIILLFVLFFGHLYAMDTRSTLNVYHDLLSSLVPKKAIRVYVLDPELKEVFSHSKRLILAKEPEESDISIVSNKIEHKRIKQKLDREKTGKSPILFATDYHLLADYPEYVGALYWRKGRSQLLFIDKRLKKRGIVLPLKYQRYSVEAL